jgi:hypothetical protein
VSTNAGQQVQSCESATAAASADRGYTQGLIVVVQAGVAREIALCCIWATFWDAFQGILALAIG